MVRRGNEDSVNIRALQNFLVVSISFGARGLAQSHAQTFLVSITNGHDFDVRFVFAVLEQQFEMVIAAAADANQGNVDAVVRSQDATPSRRSREGSAA